MLVSFILQRMVKKGYDRTRRHDSKKEIVRSIQQMLREKFAREHSESAIVKRWSDLKRRDPEFVREISERVCPGQPVPTVRSTPAHRDIHVVEVSEEEEEEAGPPTAMETSDTAPPDVAEHVEVEVEEEGGPSQPHTSPAAAIPPAEVTEEEEEQEVAAQSEEEEELVTTPQQEGINNLIKKIKGVIKDQKKKSEAFRLQMQELEKRHRLLERQNQRDLREVLDQLEQLKKHR
ncbi:neuromodulin-like [Bufo bufo]|uniref:neuromodulin-like n=2 Tax=Bufo bufo TaxID=8384 RepID=UPI001ABE2539|nr:neuromodulin-like [Bufo bufo]XP_040276529.1 neuromodulin-like [Bufo bufo]XP_040277855.1 neuromodulin-like [Bufo bufo]XP_040277934.1 neuromodulin-like [Bufo bufo]XP_040278875.1 neuromodulin-like [Bufo bufo]XP_040289269.1 neuromodulin-like [Bufo bufo]XP_040298280.1 neuromodulin-like [Bufo bufo]